MFRNSFLSFLFSFMIFKVIGDDLGGGGDPVSVVPVVVEDVPEVKVPAVEPEVVKPAEEESELDKLKAIVYENERVKAVDGLVSEIKTRHADFNPDQIRNYLVELNKTDPAKAESLNNSVGWELLHLQNFAAKPVNNDYFGHGREGGGVDRSTEILERVSSGNVSVADQAAVLAKYL